MRTRCVDLRRGYQVYLLFTNGLLGLELLQLPLSVLSCELTLLV